MYFYSVEKKTGYGTPILLTEGPFAGWMTWGNGTDPFETLIGPFCKKVDPSGRVRTAFQPRAEHLNGSGAIHGGALLSFADFSLFAIADQALKDSALSVTITCNAEFLAPGGINGWIEGEGEVLRAGRSIVFVRGLLRQNGNRILMFSGTLKKG